MKLNQVYVIFKDNSQRTAGALGGVCKKGSIKGDDMFLHHFHFLGCQESIFVENFHCEQRPKQKGDVPSGIFNEYLVLLRKLG